MSDIANFVSLHTHSEYSFLDGAIKIKDLVKKAAEFKMPAVALTDHGGLFGAVEFHCACMEKGIKPVIGFEAYVSATSRFDKNQSKEERHHHHLILLARNNEGYKNLMKLSSLGYLEGFYYKPRIDNELLAAHAEGIIATSACVGGAIPRAILEGNREKARQLAITYVKMFGEGNFYFELQNHGLDDEIVAFDEMITLGKELGIPFIVANDAHYLNKEDAAAHEILLCIQTQTTIADPNRYKFNTDQVYFKSPAEMALLFPDLPEAMSNTLDIARRCNVELKLKPQLPKPDIPSPFESQEVYIRHLAEEGLSRQYNPVTPALTERMNFELDIITRMGFSGYFLIVRDFILAAREKGLMVATRGSASGSIVAFCIGIGKTDPIKYDLLFERFLNPERISMPDIDVDFPDAQRYEVIDYVVNKYGRESVCQIINYGRMKAKMVVRDVARVMGLSVAESTMLSGKVNEKDLDSSIEGNGELKKLIESNQTYKDLFRHARVLEGLARQAGMHAGGVIIAPGPVVDYAPLFKQPSSESIMTQFDMKYVEDVGLIKMDFLGLRTYTLLQEALKLVKQYHHTDIDLYALPDGDEKTYELFGKGDTAGVFQFESQGMQDYLRKLRPTCIEDLIAMTALYRPGPMNNIDSFIKRKHGKETITYAHPMLKEILDVTYGIIVYQEQVMRIAQKMGGFSLGQADVLRKAMGKKLVDKMAEMGKKFVAGATEAGIDKKIAEEVYELMAKFAEYGFCKGHAAAYAHVSYHGAYLKAHYPLEYMTANLTSWLGDQDQFLVMKMEAERMGIRILPPDVNRSVYDCSVDGQDIRLGMAAIKNVGKAATDIIAVRAQSGPFSSIFNLCARCDCRLVNKKCLESLVMAGALDGLKGTRAALFASIDKALEYGNAMQKDKASGQLSLFDSMFGAEPVHTVPEPRLADVAPWQYNELLQKEKDVLNFYVSGHPLARFHDELRGFTDCSMRAESLERLKDNQNVTIGGIIISIRTHTQRDGKAMAFLMCEDYEGSLELIAFGEAYEKFRHLLAVDQMILVHGTVMIKEGENKPKIRVERVMALSDSREKLTRSVHIRLNTQGLDEQFLAEVCTAAKLRKGECGLVIHLLTQENNEYRIKAHRYQVSGNGESIDLFRQQLGKENVWISKNAA